MNPTSALRVMTYNVHRCVGCDGVMSPGRIARVIASANPDLVTLQELDVGRRRTRYLDQPGLIASHLQMEHHFHPAFEMESELYGDAILSRFPMRLRRVGPLPQVLRRSPTETRGALWVEVDWQGQPIHCFNTHLGLGRKERLAQVEALLSADWLGHPERQGPALLCGDFNAWPRTRAYRQLRAALGEAQDVPGHSPRGTYPSRWPVLRIDHIFHTPELRVRAVRIPRDRRARIASDHLPLIAEVVLS